MRYLLDTHTLIWTLNNPVKLSESVKSIIEDKKCYCAISKTSLFEIAIKKNIGKLDFQTSFQKIELELSDLKIDLLDMQVSYLEFYLNLPQFQNHKDPFDRLIISTAAVENLKIITKDEKFNLYQGFVETVW